MPAWEAGAFKINEVYLRNKAFVCIHKQSRIIQKLTWSISRQPRGSLLCFLPYSTRSARPLILASSGSRLPIAVHTGLELPDDLTVFSLRFSSEERLVCVPHHCTPSIGLASSKCSLKAPAAWLLLPTGTRPQLLNPSPHCRPHGEVPSTWIPLGLPTPLLPVTVPGPGWLAAVHLPGRNHGNSGPHYFWHLSCPLSAFGRKNSLMAKCSKKHSSFNTPCSCTERGPTTHSKHS